MATKVFISWSGDLSNKLAEAVRQWLPGVLQFVKPYFTPSDIEKGTRWSEEILSELESSDVGIVCMTKDNLNKPWILFESGAIAKNFEKSRVCILLFDVDTTDLKGPLTMFQHTRFTMSDFKKLVKTINGAGGEARLDDSVLDEVYKMWWPKLEKQVIKILEDQRTTDEEDQRSERDILEEILELSRLNTRRSRHDIGYPPRVLMDLVTAFSELAIAIERDDRKHANILCNRIDRAISYMCKSSDYPELYDRYMMRRRQMRLQPDGDDTEETN